LPNRPLHRSPRSHPSRSLHLSRYSLRQNLRFRRRGRRSPRQHRSLRCWRGHRGDAVALRSGTSDPSLRGVAVCSNRPSPGWKPAITPQHGYVDAAFPRARHRLSHRHHPRARRGSANGITPTSTWEDPRSRGRPFAWGEGRMHAYLIMSSGLFEDTPVRLPT